MTVVWTDEARDLIAELLEQGCSAAEIATHFPGKTRNAIIGIVTRDKRLANIGFKANPGGRAGNYVPPAKTILLGRQSSKPPKPPKKTAPKRQPPPPKPVIVSQNTDEMIADWLARNGGARRFERGESSEYFQIQKFLEERGYTFAKVASRLTIGFAGGRKKSVSWAQAIDFVDKIRRQEGLQPFKAA